jgi:ParB-like chromosome segregation protein Spo0J
MKSPRLFEIPTTAVREEVPLDKISVDEEMEGPLCRGTAKSIERMGMVFQEVVLLKEGGIYRIVAGKRRVQGALEAELDTVPALVFESGTPDSILAAITVLENMSRSPNPGVEAENLEILMRSHGWSEPSEVTKAFGIPVSHVRARLNLLKLIPEFMSQLKKGQITYAMAKGLYKLTPGEQRKLLEEEEKLTKACVETALRDKRFGDFIPAELFQIPEVPQEDTVTALIRVASMNIEKAIAITTNGRRGKLEKALQALRGE